jgi:predicted Fe-Mo cluster-binding NifX family protein
MKLTVAFSTNNSIELANCHFGDAKVFPIYEISENNYKLLNTILNPLIKNDEKIHGDPKKANSITKLIKPLGVNVLCGRQYGKNIIRIVKNFVPVIVETNNIYEAINLIQKNIIPIKNEWIKEENRKHLRIR